MATEAEVMRREIKRRREKERVKKKIQGHRHGDFCQPNDPRID